MSFWYSNSNVLCKQYFLYKNLRSIVIETSRFLLFYKLAILYIPPTSERKAVPILNNNT